MRIGLGFDIHPLAAQRKLMLGGVEIPYHLGLLGHSDADVMIHALCDALLGAIGKGDIGEHFPDTDMRFKDIASTHLLQAVLDLVRAEKYRIGNCDFAIIANQPRLSPYKEEIQQSLARALKVEKSQVNVKATTSNGVPLFGSGIHDGIAALSVVLLEKES
ncbi:MAG: 2-C-methyl-D-erythritol 2,4-cyclodiphosphate synthase [bacterium]